jgi:cytochrome b subunit of formate dehydrogenase
MNITMNTLRSTTVSTDATGMSRRSTRRACVTGFAALAVAPAIHTHAYAAAFATCGHTKVATVAWHKATTAAMHHARRPEEVASH